MRARSADTILALATGPLPAALAIFRLSGPDAFAVARALIAPVPMPAERRASLRKLFDAEGALIDEALVTLFPGPRSFTGEDLVELSVHGGVAVADHLVRAVLSHASGPSVRLAEPGEYTRRAFDAGRLDLTQAEAIADLIAAETPRQKQQALRQLDGAMTALAHDVGAQLGNALAGCEAMIDFADEGDVPGDLRVQVHNDTALALQKVTDALGTGRAGQSVRDGLQIVILGEPNVGKSTLLNALAGREAAIVTPLPGTTRDIVSVRVVIGGVPVTVLDTAGLRHAADLVEAEGIRRARKASDEADIRVWLVCAGFQQLARPREAQENDIVLLSQSDLMPGQEPPPGFDLAISALTGAGMERMRELLEAQVLLRLAGAEHAVIAQERHRLMLEGVSGALVDALECLVTGVEIEIVAENLRHARAWLDRLTGRLDVEAVLGQIFSRFCIGK